MVEIAAAADEDEDAPSKRAPSKRAPLKRNANNAQAKTEMAPSPPLLIVLMSLMPHLLILRIHLILKSLLLQ